MTQSLKKSKKLYFGVFFWELFLQIYQFLNIAILYLQAKIQKKLLTHSREKCTTDRETDGQTDNKNFIEPSRMGVNKTHMICYSIILTF